MHGETVKFDTLSIEIFTCVQNMKERPNSIQGYLHLFQRFCWERAKVIQFNKIFFT